ncbi:MAG: hypothetical protein K8T89_12630 [Planctomycetes bacterium]|nr:hypothetical protein [Planctomycetota bacterium]
MPEDSQTPIEMPRPTAAPVILATGIVLAAAGLALSNAISVVGGVVMFAGLAAWINQLLPGRGHFHEERAHPDQRPRTITPILQAVEHLHQGMPGYRLRLPLQVHPISAGLKGGLLGGLLMPIPALAWGLLKGHGIWYPINLLAGMVWAGVDQMTTAEQEQFRLPLLLVGIVIHGIMSIVLGLIYGVLLPTLPPIRGGQFVWGGVLMPLMWTGISYGLMGVVNPVLQKDVDWPWFIASQFVFGITAALVVIRTEKINVPPKGTGPDTESFSR